MSFALLTGTHQTLQNLVTQYLASLDGIPEDDLNTWLPSAEQNGGGEMNTLAALSVHTALAGSWMIVHQVFGHEFPRDRVMEFDATASRAEIEENFDTLLSRFEELIAAEPDVDLAAMPGTIRPSAPDWNRMMWLLHAIDHTALHLGHAQITQQLWLAERGGVQ